MRLFNDRHPSHSLSYRKPGNTWPWRVQRAASPDAAEARPRPASAAGWHSTPHWQGWLAAVTIALVLSAGLFLALHPSSAGAGGTGRALADTITVCPSGCMYSSIETALENAPWGSTIVVGAGQYNESIWLRGGVRVQGAGAGLSFIVWDGAAPAVSGWVDDTAGAVLDGFTIICNSPHSAIHLDFPHEKEIISNNVISNSVGQWHSGGIYIAAGATPSILNNVFVGNTLTDGEAGGAIYVNDAAPIISGNTFIGNRAKNGGALAIINETSYKATVTNNTFINNVAQIRGGAIYVNNASPSISGNQVYSNTAVIGGGVCATTQSSTVIANNQIAFNTAWGTDGAGGGVHIGDSSSATLNGNIIRYNSAPKGTGIYVESSAPLITNNVLVGNDSAQILLSGASPHVANNTIIGIQSPNSIGIDLVASSRPRIANNIITLEAYGIRGDGSALPTIRYNDLWMNSVAHYSGVTTEPNNLNVSPGLRDVANGDYHLQSTSALIDAGTMDDAPSLDFESDARPSDGNRDGIAAPDIGADEYTTGQPTPTPTGTALPSGTLVTVTLQYGLNGYSGTEDTMIYQYAPDTNYCTQKPLSIGQKQQYAALLRFDVSAIPADATVLRATLQVYCEGWSEQSDLAVGAYYITRTVDLCQATWNQAQTSNAWASPGANNTASDRRASAESSITVNGIGKWYEFDLSGVTEGWVSGRLSNNGVLLRAAYATAKYYFSSRESGNQRPRMVIVYRTAGLETATPTATVTRASPTPTATATQVSPTPTRTSSGPSTATPTPTQTSTSAPVSTPTLTVTPSASPTSTTGEITVTLQQGNNGYSGSGDTQIQQYPSDGNYCTVDMWKLGYKQQYEAVLRFDVSSVPASSVVTRAVLQVYALGWSGADITMGAYCISRTVTVCEASWSQAQTGNAWSQPGANNTSTDRRPGAEATVTTRGVGTWYSMDLTAVVQDWVTGGLANNGILLRPAFTFESFYLASTQHAAVDLRPKLVITYRGGTAPVLTPTATASSTTPAQTPTGTPTRTATPQSSPTPTPTATTPAGTPTSTATASPTPIGGATEITVTLQQGSNGYSGSEDTYAYLYAPDTNYCSQDSFKVGYKQQWVSLVRFDVSSIPANAMVARAVLQLYAMGWSGEDITVGAYGILRTMTPCQATWSQAQTGNPWSQPGANDTTTDRRPNPETTIATRGVATWYNLDLTSIVQSWVNGALANNGVLLRPAYSPNSFYFASAQQTMVDWRPKLVITYRP